MKKKKKWWRGVVCEWGERGCFGFERERRKKRPPLELGLGEEEQCGCGGKQMIYGVCVCGVGEQSGRCS